MFRKVVAYTDFLGNEREKTLYFHLTEAEVLQWEGMLSGTLSEKIQQIQQSKNLDETIKVFTEIIDKAYGDLTPDGEYFYKSPEILAKFKATQAYSKFYMELATNDEVGAAFINEIFPAEMMERLEKARAEAEAKEQAQMQVLEGGAK